MVKKLAVIDFGSKYTASIHQSLEKLGYDFDKYEVSIENPEGTDIFKEIHKKQYLGIILSGSKDNLYNENARRLPREFIGYIIQNRIPTLAICYGHQLLVHLSVGGKITLNPLGLEKGYFTFTQTQTGFPLFRGLPEKFRVNMHHFDIVENLPDTFTNFGRTKKTKIGAIQMSQNGEDKNVFGIQFHPEKSRRLVKRAIFENFYDICMKNAQ
jgi:GMP synthase (glutamine-hydrolysing)